MFKGKQPLTLLMFTIVTVLLFISFGCQPVKSVFQNYGRRVWMPGGRADTIPGQHE